MKDRQPDGTLGMRWQAVARMEWTPGGGDDRPAEAYRNKEGASTPAIEAPARRMDERLFEGLSLGLDEPLRKKFGGFHGVSRFLTASLNARPSTV